MIDSTAAGMGGVKDPFCVLTGNSRMERTFNFVIKGLSAFLEWGRGSSNKLH